MSKPFLSVVLPAYMEEENLRLLLPQIKTEVGKTKKEFEIIVVDTAEKMDATEEVCKEMNVRYVRRSPGQTFGDAVRTGITFADGHWILFMDADGSHSPEFIPRLVEKAGEYDVVVASRYVKGGATENSAVLIWMSRILNFTYSHILNLKCKDVSNSFKIYRASLLKDLDLVCHNFDIIEEILFTICHENKDLKILEIPFTFKKRVHGETKRNLFIFVITYIFTILKLRLLPLRKMKKPVSSFRAVKQNS